MVRDDPGCLPPSGTLRRIRWPLTAPVPRPPHRLSSDVTTSERRSLAILGLGRSTPFHSGDCRRTVCPFTRRAHRRSHADRLAELGPRSLAPPLFWERCVRAYLGPDTARRLLQLHSDVRATKPGLSLLLAGTRTVILFLSFRITRFLLRGGDTGQAARPSDLSSPGAGSSWLPRFARPRYRTDRATPPGF